MLNQMPPEIVADDEQIASIIFSPSMIINGDVSPTAFQLRMLKKPEDYVSVFRENYLIPTRANVDMIKPPADNIVYGYASLKVQKCRGVGFNGVSIDVLAHPNARNPFHAGIHFSKDGMAIKGTCRLPEFIVVASRLAKTAKLVAF